MAIFGLIVGTFIRICFGTGIFCSGVGVGLGVGRTGGARAIAHFRSLAMYYTDLVVVYP